MFEWKPIEVSELRERFLDVETLERLWLYQNEIVRLILIYLGRTVHLEPFYIGGVKQMPFAEVINIIERNNRLIVGADAVQGIMPIVVWRGGLLDHRRLSFLDVNRWFLTIELLYRHILGLMPTDFTTGDWETGDHLEFQSIGIL